MPYPTNVSVNQAYRTAELHRLEIEGKHYILCAPYSALFGLGELTGAIIDVFKEDAPVTFSQLLKALDAKWPRSEVKRGIAELIDTKLIRPVNKTPEPHSQRPSLLLDQPISTLICILSKDCNLCCGYCYAEQGTFKGRKGLMTEELALRAVDFLIEHSGKNRGVQFTFFGGEPLLNFPVIKSVVLYGRNRADAAGKIMHFSMTTNGTLLTQEIVEFLSDEHIGITISIDGPGDIHDRVRKYQDGKGSYKIIRRNLKELFKFYKNGRVGARVTVTRNALNIKDILFHLLGLGFGEVGFSPVTTPDDRYALSEAELEVFTGEFQELSELYVKEAINHRHLGFSNLSNLLKQIHEGANKSYPCGGGIGLMGMDADGELYVCHRLIGAKEFSLGDVHGGINKERQRVFLSEVQMDRKGECQNCWARYLCGGGCYHEIFSRHGTVSSIPSIYCKWVRQWFEIGIRAYIRISETNPDFIEKGIEGRPTC